MQETGFKYEGELEKISADEWCNEDCTPVVVSPNRTVHGIFTIKNRKLEELPIDAVFPILHGKEWGGRNHTGIV